MADVKLKATGPGGAVARPPRTVDFRQRNVKNMLKATDQSPGSVPPPIDLANPVSLAATQPSGTPDNPQLGVPGANPGLLTDPNSLSRTITPENSLRDQRLGFGVEAQNVGATQGTAGVALNFNSNEAIRNAFESNLGMLNQDMVDQSRELAMRTSALGRAGSGLFNRDTGFISDRSRQTRESLLGNLAFRAIQADQGRNLQASIANQNAELSTQAINARIAQGNAGRAQDVGFARQRQMEGLQTREDMLARQAMGDRRMQMMLLQAGFGGAPFAQMGQEANGLVNASGQFADNAGVVNNQLSNVAQAGVQAFSQPQGVPLPPDITQIDEALANFRPEGMGF